MFTTGRVPLFYLGLSAYKGMKELGVIIKKEAIKTEQNKSTVLLVSLTIQRSSKVNIIDNNVESSTSRIVYITRSNMNSCIFKLMALYVDFMFKCIIHKEGNSLILIQGLYHSSWCFSRLLSIRQKGQTWTIMNFRKKVY